MQEYSSTSQPPPPSLLVTILSHVLNLPRKTIHARVCRLNFTDSPLQEFLSRFQVIFLISPPKTLMQEYASTSQPPLSKTSCHDSKSFFNFLPPKPYMQSIPQLHSLPYPSLLVTILSHFLNLPPQNPTCKSMPQLHRLPLQEFLSRFQVIY